MKTLNIVRFYIALLISVFFFWVGGAFWWDFVWAFKKKPGRFFWVGLNYDNLARQTSIL